MACFSFVLSLTTLLVYATAQDICDIVTKMCANGVCEFQANNQMGCTCNPGYVPDPTNPLVCNAIPSCNLLPGTPDQQCLNGMCRQQIPGLYRCICSPGFQSSKNPNICEDVDECQLFFNGCSPGACSNTPGGFFCTNCVPGYALDQMYRCQRIPASDTQNPWAMAWVADNFLF